MTRFVRSALLLAVLVVSFSPACFAQSEYYVVASRTAVIRATPELTGDRLETLEKGDARVVETSAADQPVQLEGYYRVRTLDGAWGWVSRYVVRVHFGVPVIDDVDPGASSQPVGAESEGEEGALGGRRSRAQLDAFAREHTGAIGLPRGQILLVNEGYLVGYDTRLKIAAWVQYRLTRDDFATGERDDSFRPDGRLEPHQRSTLTDYETASTKSIWRALGMSLNASSGQNFYARGHIVPDASQTRDEQLQRDTYLLSNMAPHVQMGFNSGTWSTLEKAIRGWCQERGELYVIAGPIFRSSARVIDPALTEDERVAVLDNLDNEPTVRAQPPTERQVVYNVLGEQEVAVPSAMFCVVVDMENPSKPDALAFVIDNARRTRDQGRSVEDTLVSIDAIEMLTGFDLLASLADDVEAVLESRTAESIWP